jgi:magnesium transporter
VEEKEVKEIDDAFLFKDDKRITWINIEGLQKISIIEKIGNHFNLHPLVLEDIANTGQRPKMEDYTDYLFVVLNMLQYSEEDKEIKREQVSLILGSNWVISFQETEGDVFDTIRERLRSDKGRIRKMGADYLVYVLMDTIVDNYFAVLEKIGEKIEEIEDEIVTNPSPVTLQTMHDLKRQMIMLRKSIWPLREVINRLERWESKLINESTDIFLRDLYDHTIQVVDAVETFRDMLSGMMDIYMSSVSNRMNEVMKVLTIIATIFLPLTLVAGIYGMNFRIMPELQWEMGYPFALLIMLAVGIIMLIYFKRKNWL